MLATIAAAASASTVRKKRSVFINSEAGPHAMYAMYKQTRTLCVLQYMSVLICEYLIGKNAQDEFLPLRILFGSLTRRCVW